MEDKKLNEQESLALIAGMIKNTQNRLERNAGAPFLIWGYTTVVISVVIWVLFRFTENPHWQFLWFALPVISFPLTLKFSGKQVKGVVTYVDQVINNVWLVMGTAGFIVSLFSIVASFVSSFRLNFPILFCIILLMGMGTAITGLAVKFRPLIWSGFLSMGLSYLCFFFRGIDSILIFALVFVVMMVIPGHILNAKAKKLNTDV